MAARCAAEALNRPFEKFNMGSTDDARATLIGNTAYKKEFGTVFYKSSFVNAITTPNSVVLLDEISRGTHSAWNILMTVIDPTQRYLRLDENESGEVVEVASGVCFIATANIGSEFTSTRTLDRALSRRFPVKIEMHPLNGEELVRLFQITFPTRSEDVNNLFVTLANISDDLIAQCKVEDSPISSAISPANMVEMAELAMDGFTLEEIAQVAIYPEYSNDGSGDSEREFVRTVVKKYIPTLATNPVRDPRIPRRR
jgi:MoxR-like ATPase